jgi:hypothetical protein
VPIVVPIVVGDSRQTSDLPEGNRKNDGQALVTVIPGVAEEPRKPVKPVEPAPPVQAAAQIKTNTAFSSSPSGACAPYGHDLTKPLGSEVTIGQRFAIKGDIGLLQDISDGEYNVYAYKDDIDNIAKYARMVVEGIAGVPWDNQRATLGDIMDSVAKRMSRDKLEWPAGWLAVLKELRKGGQCHTKYTPPRNPNWVGYQNHDGPPNEMDVRARINSDFQMCDDWICRNDAGREAADFTAKNSVGAWVKP